MTETGMTETGMTEAGMTATATALGSRLHAQRVTVQARMVAPRIRRHARAEAARLAATGDPTARRLAEAVDHVASDDVGDEERETIRRIESARQDTLRSPDLVTWSGGRRESIAWICARASQPPAGARMLHQLLAVWQPSRALELGTCVGISGAYQAAALPAEGTLTSLEAYGDLARRAESTWRGVGLDNAAVVVGRFARTLGRVLSRGGWGYAFIDGNHEGQATQSYVDRIAAAAEPGALLVLDDIDYNDGMRDAWETVQQREDVAATTTLGKLGLLALR